MMMSFKRCKVDTNFPAVARLGYKDYATIEDVFAIAQGVKG